MDAAKMDMIVGLAAWKASPDILLCLLDHVDSLDQKAKTDIYLDSALAMAIHGPVLPNIKILLSRGANIMSPSSLNFSLTGLGWPYDIGCSGLLRALMLWDKELIRYLIEECGVTLPQKWPNTTSHMQHPANIFRRPRVLGKTLNDARRQFEEMKPYIIWPEAIEIGPYYAASRPANVLSAKICLENGGDPDSQWMTESALYCAVREGIREGPEVAKALLQHGANPRANGAGIMESLAGMKRIERYFGTSWNDIVRRTQAGEDLRGG
jgi:hypothetical protein